MAHTYPSTLSWHGSTLDKGYPTDAGAGAPGKPSIPVSSAPEFRGSADRWNPEDLFGTALATCHMLTFLALCAKTQVEVRDYQDQVETVLDAAGRPARIAEVHLRPVIRVAPGVPMAKVLELFEKAHKYCFIANSVSCRVVLAARVVEG